MKLGYGGTKEEMERLIEDANRYRESIGETSDLSIDSFADIVLAIESIQQAQGIAGTTAKEAMTTIEGSANATKAAWQNVLTAIAGGGDLTEAINGLIVGIFGENEGEGLLNQVIPRIQTALEGMADFISKAAPIFSAKFPELIEAIIPSLISSAISLVAALVAQLPSILGSLISGIIKGITDAIPAVSKAFSTLSTDSLSSLLDGLPEMISAGVEWIENIATGIVDAIPSAIEAIGNFVTGAVEFLIENLPQFVERGAEMIMNIISGIVEAIPDAIQSVSEFIASFIGMIAEHLPEFLQKGIDIVTNIITGLIDSIPQIVEAIPQIVSNMASAFTSFDWVGLGIGLIESIANGVTNALTSVVQAFGSVNDQATSTVISNVPKMLDAGIQWVANMANGVIEKIPEMVASLANLVNQALDLLIENLPKFMQNGIDMVVNLVKGLLGSLPDAVKASFTLSTELLKSIAERLPEFLQKGIELVGQIVAGLLEAIPQIIGTIPDFLNAAGEIISAIWDEFTSIDWWELGTSIIDAIIDGIVQAGGKIWDTLKGVLSDTWDTVTGWFGFSSNSEGTGGGEFAPASANGIMAFSEAGGDEGESTGGAGGRVMSRAKAATFSRSNNLFGAIGDAMANNFVSARTANLAIPIEEKQDNESRTLETDKKLDDLLAMCTEYFPTFAKVKVMLDTGAMVGEMLPDIDEGLADRLDFANAG